MPDPFEALYLPTTDADPDPTFAARLRARVERALSLPEGVTVSNLTVEPAPAPTPATGAPTGVAARVAPGSVVPYLIVEDARRALDWYVAALGANRRGDVIVMSDGRVGHAELELRGSVLYLADESPESQVAAPRAGAGATVSFTFEVPDVDGSVDRALAAGAVLERPLADNPYGRNAVVRDPFGHRWIISSMSTEQEPDVADPVRQGDIGYVSLWVPDADRAATFFATVLGWSYGPQMPGHSRQVADRLLHHGVDGGHDRSSLFLCFVVDDVAGAVARVREAGGGADEPTMEPFGLAAMCTDVEGTPFSLYQPAPGPRGPRLAANGSRHGDVSYITMEVVDSAAVRAFYGAVLGWHFTPGHVEDGWGCEDVVPMTGLHGGHPVTTILPMYLVDDIYAAVARVRAAGGSAPEPERRPYGLSAECVDDQGTRFYLGQH
ncbi:MAG TPA: VOC family protein [Acidimicrobiales bacterium]|nr:VOC family protein [Acidimicrobiales bacterium]